MADPDFGRSVSATLSQPGEQIMPSTIIHGPRGFASPPTFGTFVIRVPTDFEPSLDIDL